MELTLEQCIIHHLLLRSSIMKDVSLYHGKMGLILFFAHYYKHTGNLVYEDTADELMSELNEDVLQGRLPVGLAIGLSGIGWGIEYLIQNGFTDDDSLEICEELDNKIMEKDPRRITDYSLETGLEGILHYVLAHIKGVMFKHSKLPFDETYLFDLYQAISKIPQETELSENFKILLFQYVDFYKNRSTNLQYNLQLSPFIDDVEIEMRTLRNIPLGLKKGMSGFLLKKLIYC